MEVPVQALRRNFDAELTGFETTDDLEPVFGIVGQPRAAAAVAFGTDIERPGFNVFAFGLPGTGKRSFLRQFLESRAAGRPTPPDLCYVHNFDDARRPLLVRLPAGSGGDFRREIDRLTEDMRAGIAAAFESEEYQQQRHLIDDDFKQRPEKELDAIAERARGRGIALIRTDGGLSFAALHGEEALTEEQFAALPEDRRKQLEAIVAEFEEEVQQTVRHIPRWSRERRESLRALNRDVASAAVDPPLKELQAKYQDHRDVRRHLEAIRQHAIEHARALAGSDDQMPPPLTEAMGGRPSSADPARLYRVSVLVDHAGSSGAPVVYEDNPTYDNLIGRIEYTTEMGALATDHTLIKAGALLRATGGYLLLDMHRLLQTPHAWDALKRALANREVRIEPLAQVLGLASAVSLDPEPAALQVQIVLMGDPHIYAMVHALDPDFLEHFKVAADFAETMSAADDHPLVYARLLATLCRQERIRPLRTTAVARVMEHSARLASDQQKLSAQMAVVMDLVLEADYWAGQAEHPSVEREDVERAITAQILRADRPRERYLEAVVRGTVLIDTEGERVGQVNGLAVSSYGTFAFGHPSRITARIRLGEGDLVNIEREVDLSGPIHSKGVLILSGLLGARYAADRPLSFSATLAFEQSYGPIDGDSASAAELFALLSAIAGTPLRQDLAVTGSINQHGDVQPIGGVNEKVEGFYDVCVTGGLTGRQGVVIPQSNVPHLMLRQDVVDAVGAGRFHVHAITSVDEGIELLTGLPAGTQDADGSYPAGCFHARVSARLHQLAERRREFTSPSASGNPAESREASQTGP
ncbi:MAG: AAA family ATPase [Gemmatimonadota bacterium]|nr:AAA family ATPase [Gemmatimonadota bacterium]MDH4349530.1 AAA family ATPase [Gemmatimonadota bacterium]